MRALHILAVVLISIVANFAERPCFGFGLTVLIGKAECAPMNDFMRLVNETTGNDYEINPINNIIRNQVLRGDSSNTIGRKSDSRIDNPAVFVRAGIEAFIKIMGDAIFRYAHLVSISRNGKWSQIEEKIQTRFAPRIVIRNQDMQFVAYGQGSYRARGSGTDPSSLAGLGYISRYLRGVGQPVSAVDGGLRSRQLIDHDAALALRIVVADPNSRDADKGSRPQAENLKLAPAPFVFGLGCLLVIGSAKLLSNAIDRSDKRFYSIVILGFIPFCLGGLAMLFCILPDPPPIFGFVIGPWH